MKIKVFMVTKKGVEFKVPILHSKEGIQLKEEDIIVVILMSDGQQTTHHRLGSEPVIIDFLLGTIEANDKMFTYRG